MLMQPPEIYPNVFKDLFINEVKRRLMQEGVPRIRKCLSLLSEEEIWHRENKYTNSVGNLVLHLCGNVRQWVIAGMGGAEDDRRREEEFAEEGPIPAAELLKRLDQLMAEVEEVLDELPPHSLLDPKQIQGFDENGISVLVHVVEHFSYHVGQITYIVKSSKKVDTAYYGGMDLGVHNEEGSTE